MIRKVLYLLGQVILFLVSIYVLYWIVTRFFSNPYYWMGQHERRTHEQNAQAGIVPVPHSG